MNHLYYFRHARTLLGVPHSIVHSQVEKGGPSNWDLLNLHMQDRKAYIII